MSTTYSRKKAREEDQENVNRDESEGSTSEVEDAVPGKIVAFDGKAKAQMERMAAKFREVDAWEMEFEEVTGSSDRMKDAR